MPLGLEYDNSTLYCSTGDVARYMRGFPGLTSGDDFPTEAEAEAGNASQADATRLIEKYSTKFDRRTRQSFRPNQVFDEHHDHARLYYWLSGHPIRCDKRNIITPLDTAKGDKLEVWTGNKWRDWVADSTRSEGRDEDYWVQSSDGIIWLYERAILRPHPKFRVSYRYGSPAGDDGEPEYVPADVRDAVAAAAAADIIQGDVYGTTVPGNAERDGASVDRMAERWRKQFRATYADYKKASYV